MRIRMHRGAYVDSMATEETIEPTEPAVRAFLARHGVFNVPNEVKVEFHSNTPWRAWPADYFVLLDGQAVGMTDGPLI